MTFSGSNSECLDVFGKYIYWYVNTSLEWPGQVGISGHRVKVKVTEARKRVFAGDPYTSMIALYDDDQLYICALK